MGQIGTYYRFIWTYCYYWPDIRKKSTIPLALLLVITGIII